MVQTTRRPDSRAQKPPTTFPVISTPSARFQGPDACNNSQTCTAAAGIPVPVQEFIYFCLMGHKKLKRFAEIETFPNVFQYPEGMQGKWQEVFKNHHPIVLELACGKGEYTIALAEKYPNKNLIGVDLKGNRIWKGASYALSKGLANAAFIRTQIGMIANYFSPGEVEEIWITFPDPQLRQSRAKKRLTHPNFLKEYEKILKKDAVIHLKTDSPDLYAFTKEVIDWCGLIPLDDLQDVYASPDIHDDLRIKTYYETLDIAKSNKVFYLRWQLPAEWNRGLEEFKKHLKNKFPAYEE